MPELQAWLSRRGKTCPNPELHPAAPRRGRCAGRLAAQRNSEFQDRRPRAAPPGIRPPWPLPLPPSLPSRRELRDRNPTLSTARFPDTRLVSQLRPPHPPESAGGPARLSRYLPVKFRVGAADVIGIERERIRNLAALRALIAESADERSENRRNLLDGRCSLLNLRHLPGNNFRLRRHDCEI